MRGVFVTGTGTGVGKTAVAGAACAALAARPGLGTINHTLLTLEAARAVGLSVGATVLTPWPADPDDVARSNRQTIARLGAVPVATLPPLPSAEPAALAQAGAQLPLDDWLG